MILHLNHKSVFLQIVNKKNVNKTVSIHETRLIFD